MDEQVTPGELERRAFIKRAGIVAGATVWATPTIQALAAPAFAAGTGLCPPERTVKFKYEVTNCVGRFVDAGNGESCVETVDGYTTAQLQVDGNGCYPPGTMNYCVKIELTCNDEENEANQAVVKITHGSELLDVSVKSGKAHDSSDCDPGSPNSDGSYSVEIIDGISYIAGTFCLPAAS